MQEEKNVCKAQGGDAALKEAVPESSSPESSFSESPSPESSFSESPSPESLLPESPVDADAEKTREADPPLQPLDEVAGKDVPRAQASPQAPAPLSAKDAKRLLEALLFAAPHPLSIADLRARLPDPEALPSLLAELEQDYQGRGITLRAVAGGWILRTAPDLADHLQQIKVQPRHLSAAVTETLTIVAYLQPITRAEIEEIRGHKLSQGTMNRLLEERWIRSAGRKETPGRPMMWATTSTFLEHFDLNSLDDLPGRQDLQQAGLLQSADLTDTGLPFLASDQDPPTPDAESPKAFKADAESPKADKAHEETVLSRHAQEILARFDEKTADSSHE